MRYRRRNRRVTQMFARTNDTFAEKLGVSLPKSPVCVRVPEPSTSGKRKYILAVATGKTYLPPGLITVSLVGRTPEIGSEARRTKIPDGHKPNWISSTRTSRRIDQ